jgi:outer membrane protein OmpA-like peptidoglycan-associated protein
MKPALSVFRVAGRPRFLDHSDQIKRQEMRQIQAQFHHWLVRLAMRGLLGGLLISGSTWALDYGATIDGTEWQLTPAALVCRLTQAVPGYGVLGFEQQAGDATRFFLESLRPATRKGSVALATKAPFWRPGMREVDLGEAACQTGRRPIDLDADWANRLIDHLQTGAFIEMSMHAWSDAADLTVVVSSVHFQQAYEGFIACQGGLFPSNFEQLRNTTFRYDTNVWGLSRADKDRLDLIVDYMKLDPLVHQIRIHAHTDNQGRKGHNWELSRLRGQAVVDYLKRRGLAEEQLVMNYWAHTRPKVPNTSKANQAINRRTYIEMVRHEE